MLFVALDPKPLAEQFEQLVADLLTPITAGADRIMCRVDEWLESRAASGADGRPLFTPPVGEPIVSDMAQGMLTAELLEGPI
jgi:hypothetical protein